MRPLTGERSLAAIQSPAPTPPQASGSSIDGITGSPDPSRVHEPDTLPIHLLCCISQPIKSRELLAGTCKIAVSSIFSRQTIRAQNRFVRHYSSLPSTVTLQRSGLYKAASSAFPA